MCTEAYGLTIRESNRGLLIKAAQENGSQMIERLGRQLEVEMLYELAYSWLKGRR